MPSVRPSRRASTESPASFRGSSSRWIRSAATEQASAHTRSPAADRSTGAAESIRRASSTASSSPEPERTVEPERSPEPPASASPSPAPNSPPSLPRTCSSRSPHSAAPASSASPAHRGRRTSSSPPSSGTQRSKQANPLTASPRSSAWPISSTRLIHASLAERYSLTEPALPLTARDGPGVSQGHHTEPVEHTKEEVFGQQVGFGAQYVEQRLLRHLVPRLRRPGDGPRGRVPGFEEVVLQGQPLLAAPDVPGHGGTGQTGRPGPALRPRRLQDDRRAVHDVSEERRRTALQGNGVHV